MNGRLYDPLLRRFLNADENIQDPYNTQNYNKYGYVMNNPLLYNDPSGEVFVVLGSAILGAIITGTAIGVVAYTITLGITGNIDNWSIGGAMKSMFFGSVGGAASFGVGSLFSSHLTGATAIATSIKESVGGVGLVVVQAGTHAVSQGVLGLMQGQNFLSASLSGFAGSVGASGWSSIVGSNGASRIAFGALSGGVASELSGGNFWQGAFSGGIVVGLNHAMHKLEPDNGYDRNGKRINNKGGDETDYLYDEDGKIIASTSVQIIEEYSEFPTYKLDEYGKRWVRVGGGLYDPSFEMMKSYVLGKSLSSGIGFITEGSFIIEGLVVRTGGQTTFAIKWLNKTKDFMFRFERHDISFPKIGYRTHINLHWLKTKINKHIFLNPKYWKNSNWK